MNLSRLIKRAASNFLLSKQTFTLFQKFGLSLVRTRESPIPDTRLLCQQDDLWNRESELIGIDMNVDGQLAMLNQVFCLYKEECDFAKSKGNTTHEFYVYNDSFGLLSAITLHSMIRHFKPRTILEVGSGNSTFVSARASLMNQGDGHDTNLIAIEPYPREVHRQGFPGLTRLIQSPVESLDLSLFSDLVPNDILFIDGSHYVKIGGDVNFLFLEVLPRLQSGVFVHIHDIFFPFEYPKKWIQEDRTFYSEQQLLQAFLTYNRTFEVLWAEHYMKAKYPEECEAALSNLLGYNENHQSNSFWMRRL